MKSKHDSRLLLGLVILAGVLFVGYIVWKYEMGEQTTDVPVVETPAEEVPSGSTSGSTGGTAPSGPLTFDEAYELYADNYRFEFADCHGRPGSLSMKKGTKFMLDNRDNEAHRLVVGSKAYNLGPYGFAIATATEVGTYNITCDGGGAAQVIVQP